MAAVNARSGGSHPIAPERSGKCSFPLVKEALRSRLVWFGGVIAAVIVVMAWAAATSWAHARTVAERLNTVDIESFRLADHFEQSILELDYLLLRFAQRRDEVLWKEFDQTSDELNVWLSEQAPRLQSDQEKNLLASLDAAYDVYLDAARKLAGNRRGGAGEAVALEDLARFERESRRLLQLGSGLAEAHRRTLRGFLRDTGHTLELLRNLLLASLVALVATGGALVVAVYRGLLRPLQGRLREAQAVAERHEKLASLGVLAAGLAHEIRNPLTAIKARVYMLRKRLTDGSPDTAAVEIIEDEIGRLERIVRDVLQFARPSDPQFAPVSLPTLLGAVKALLGPSLERSGVELIVSGENEAMVMADEQQLKQVMINLVQNGAEACGPGGRVTLRTALESARFEGRPSAAVRIEVIDTGAGIPTEVERRLFDPFFTTKAGGTGLGLSIAARIVERHGGTLQYRTQRGSGTTFGVILPRAAGG